MREKDYTTEIWHKSKVVTDITEFPHKRRGKKKDDTEGRFDPPI